MKKCLVVLLSIAMIISCCAFTATAVSQTPPFELSSLSAISIDAGTGQVLMEKDADTPRPIAGAVKVMSLLLFYEALENGQFTLQDEVHISQQAASMGGTQAFLESGGTYTAEQLLYTVCMASANDSTVALAEKIFGSEQSMVARMNERAQELGCTQTTFDNTTGLDSASATTARELAIIAQELCKYRAVFINTAEYLHTFTHPTGRVTELVNANRLVRFYQNCDGLMTGSSAQAQYAGVFTAKRGDLRLIAVTLQAKDSNSRFEDAKKLLDDGFANYTSRVVVRKGEVLQKDVAISGGSVKAIDIEAKEEIRVTLQKGDEKQIRKELELKPELVAPILKGDVLGTLHVYIGDTEIATVDAVASAEITELSFMAVLRRIAIFWIRG